MRSKYFCLIALLMFSVNASSQIEGDVRDKLNSRIRGAKIFAVDSTNLIADSVMTDETGFYRFTNLRPGLYLIEAKATGFEIRHYKNVIARTKVKNPVAGNDISNATRLQIVLTPS